MPRLYSQCSNCGTTFTVQTEQVFFALNLVIISMIYIKTKKKGARMKTENYQTMSLFRLNKECLIGNKAALEEWERRWEEKFPEIKKLPDGRSGNQKLSTP